MFQEGKTDQSDRIMRGVVRKNPYYAGKPPQRSVSGLSTPRQFISALFQAHTLETALMYLQSRRLFRPIVHES